MSLILKVFFRFQRSRFLCRGFSGWIVLCGICSSLPTFAQSAAAPAPYRDPSLPLDVRVHDLINRLTLDEKAGLMKNAAEGVPRLDLPPYDWWNEGLHGVARAGEATVFPQAIGLAAMWNEDLMRTVGDAISTEARAKYHDALHRGHAGERYRGLTLWSPNINIFRDPRWGRGQETYGEDPFLTGRTGVAFVRGLQGDDPRHLKTAATAKHLAVHSGPESTRYHVDVEPPRADLYDTYLPAFESLVRDGQVEAVMTAYNALYGEPCSMSPLLFGLLRRWGFGGYVVGDCGAVYCLYEKYQVAPDFPSAEAMAVKAGLNLRCGSGDAQLAIAVRRGLLTEAELDAGLAPLLRTWFRLGFFDPSGAGPYSATPLSENNSPAHAALAREAARQSIVLLKNDGTLPLDRAKLHRAAVIGPNAASVSVLLGNYHGRPTAPVTVLAGLRTAFGPEVLVDYAKGCDYAETKTGPVAVPRTALSSGCDCDASDEGDTTGLQGEYFANQTLAGTPAAKQRNHQIEFAWAGKSPVEGVAAENFSVRWTGTLHAALTGNYQFNLVTSGGARLYLDDALVFDKWNPEASGPIAYKIVRDFTADAAVSIRLEYVHRPPDASAAISLQWTAPPADAGFGIALARARVSDVVIFVGGISPELEGEDMRVDYAGFTGGDRTRIELPAVQQRLLKELAAIGKPLVFVNLSGSAVAFPAIDACANAIVQAWYPGQAGGSAVADILLGAVNPAGRLPVTFYRSTDDLPAFDDYHMANRTYRYFHGAPLYPFGHGLGYTHFAYSNLNVTRKADGALSATVDITDTGARDGDEVVQLYLEEPATTHPRALRSLAGFHRIHLAAGAKQTVTFAIAPASLRRWSEEKNDYHVPAGEWRLLVGASSADIRQSAMAILP